MEQPGARNGLIISTSIWGDKTTEPCHIIRETATKYEIQVDKYTAVPPGNRILIPKLKWLVPKRYVKVVE